METDESGSSNCNFQYSVLCKCAISRERKLLDYCLQWKDIGWLNTCDFSLWIWISGFIHKAFNVIDFNFVLPYQIDFWFLKNIIFFPALNCLNWLPLYICWTNSETLTWALSTNAVDPSWSAPLPKQLPPTLSCRLPCTEPASPKPSRGTGVSALPGFFPHKSKAKSQTWNWRGK